MAVAVRSTATKSPSPQGGVGAAPHGLGRRHEVTEGTAPVRWGQALHNFPKIDGIATAGATPEKST